MVLGKTGRSRQDRTIGVDQSQYPQVDQQPQDRLSTLMRLIRKIRELVAESNLAKLPETPDRDGLASQR